MNTIDWSLQIATTDKRIDQLLVELIAVEMVPFRSDSDL